MGFGSPDHVRKQDVNVTDYDTVGFYDVLIAVPGLTHYTPVDVLGIGSMGLMFFRTDNENMIFMVTIDGVDVSYSTIKVLKTYFAPISSSLSNYAGVTQYDEINNSFCIWVDFHYLLPFKKSLKVDFYNGGIPACNIFLIQAYYKLKG